MSWTFLRTRRVMRYYFKTFANGVCRRVRKKPLFKITRIERLQAVGNLGFPNKQIAKLARIRALLFSETFLGPTLIVLLFLIIGAWFGHRLYKPITVSDLLDANLGLIFDVVFIVILIGVFQFKLDRRRNIAAQHEIIEDLKRWDSEAAMHRVVGAIRRLNGMGQTTVDLTGAALSNASLKGYGVTSLRGSKLSGGGWVDETLRNSSFKDVDFSRLDLRDAVFGIDAWVFGRAKSGRYVDCNFWEADLQGSRFEAAELHWTTRPPDTLDEVIAKEDGGRPIIARIHHDSFNDTDLAHASFRKCDFKWADFREAYNIDKADFSGATGLETCVFDSDELKQKIIAKSKEAKE